MANVRVGWSPQRQSTTAIKRMVDQAYQTRTPLRDSILNSPLEREDPSTTKKPEVETDVWFADKDPGGGPPGDPGGVGGAVEGTTDAAIAMGFGPDSTATQSLSGFLGAISPTGLLGLAAKGLKGAVFGVDEAEPALDLDPMSTPNDDASFFGFDANFGTTPSVAPNDDASFFGLDANLGDIAADPATSDPIGLFGQAFDAAINSSFDDAVASADPEGEGSSGGMGSSGGIGGGPGGGLGPEGASGEGDTGTGIAGAGGEGAGVCIIITACTSEDSPEVNVTREYRDKYLDPGSLSGYYLIAAFVVPVIKRFAIAKWVVRHILVDRLVDYGAYTLGKRKGMAYRTSEFVAQNFLRLCRIAGRFVGWTTKAARLTT